MTNSEFTALAITAHPLWLKCISKDEWRELTKEQDEQVSTYVAQCVLRQYESVVKKQQKD